MSGILKISHIVIETINLKNDLKFFLEIGYNIKFNKNNMKIPKEKIVVLHKEPTKVKAIFLEKLNSLSIELISHDIQKKTNNINMLIGSCNRKIKHPLFINNSIFSQNMDILINSKSLINQLEFFKNNLCMKEKKISDKSKQYLLTIFEDSHDVRKLSLKKNIFNNIQIHNLYLIGTKGKPKKQYLNQEGVSCISFIEFNNYFRNLSKYKIIGPLKLNIKESKISNYYFSYDPNKNLIEYLN